MISDLENNRSGTSEHQLQFQREHAIETYKSLITISVEVFKACFLINGGAIVAVLAFLGSVAADAKFRGLLSAAALPLGCFSAGLVFAAVAFIFSYFTQLSLYQEIRHGKDPGNHQCHLRFATVCCVLSLVFFIAGACSSLGALQATLESR